MTVKKIVFRRGWLGSIALLLALVVIAGSLAAWKRASIQESMEAAARQPEPMEAITVAVAKERDHREATTSIGTVLALRSVSLRNELAGTIREVNLSPGQIVESGTLLVALDVSVESAELKAQEAQAVLAETQLARVERAVQSHAVSEMEVDRAQAEHDVAVAQIARIKAIIDRKTIRAPFRARVGLSDVHVGQYLAEGTLLTTLQGMNDPPAVHVDFTVAQQVAATLSEGDSVDVAASGGGTQSFRATIIAIDARVDQTTRNALIRAKIEGDSGALLPAPGASVRVRVPVGPSIAAVAVPVTAVRKGPGGDHVFVIAQDKDGKDRAHLRPVQAGTMLGDEILIHHGLSVGERVAASGSFKLRESVLVAISGGAAPGSVQAR